MRLGCSRLAAGKHAQIVNAVQVVCVVVRNKDCVKPRDAVCQRLYAELRARVYDKRCISLCAAAFKQRTCSGSLVFGVAGGAGAARTADDGDAVAGAGTEKRASHKKSINVHICRVKGVRMNIVIIGSGIAAVTAAAELRKLHPGTELCIDMVSADTPPDYTRPRLPEVVAGTADPAALTIRKADWFAARHITLHNPARAVRIDRAAKQVFVQKDSAEYGLSYDGLLIAAGAQANRPAVPQPGSPAFGSVFALRTMSDALALKAHLAPHTESAVIVGGGLLGIEAARAVKHAGVRRVHVIETAPRMLPRQLDERGSELLSAYLEQTGLIVHTGQAPDLKRLETERAAEVFRAVCADDGIETVLYSVGVRPDTALAADCGLACARGIIVNDAMQTSDAAVYAAGDCAEFNGVCWGIVPSALEQASAAARMMLYALYGGAEPARYVQTVPSAMLRVGEREAVSGGKAVLTPEEIGSGRYALVHREAAAGAETEKSAALYAKAVIDLQAGTVAGGLVFGTQGAAAACARRLAPLIGRPEADASVFLEELIPNAV